MLLLALCTVTAVAQNQTDQSSKAGAATPSPKGSEEKSDPSLRSDGMFDWQFPSANKEADWKKYSFSIDRWWGSFPHDLPESMDMFADHPWALGPWSKYAGNPVLAPTPGAWDQGHYGGGVHNGSIIVKDGKFYYIYRGERPMDIEHATGSYICDIGVR